MTTFMDSIEAKKQGQDIGFPSLEEAMEALEGKNFGELLYEVEMYMRQGIFWFDARYPDDERRQIHIGEVLYRKLSEIPEDEFDVPRWNIFVESHKKMLISIDVLELPVFAYLERQKRSYDYAMVQTGAVYGDWNNQFYKYAVTASGEIMKRERDTKDRDVEEAIREGLDLRQYDFWIPSKVRNSTDENMDRLFLLELVVSDYIHRRYGKEKMMELGKSCVYSMMMEECFTNAQLIGLLNKRLKEGIIRRSSVFRPDIYTDLMAVVDELLKYLAGLMIEKRERDKRNKAERERRSQMEKEQRLMVPENRVDRTGRDISRRVALVAGAAMVAAAAGGIVYSFVRDKEISVEGVGNARAGEIVLKKSSEDEKVEDLDSGERTDIEKKDTGRETEVGPVEVAQGDLIEPQQEEYLSINVKKRAFGGYKLDARDSRKLWEEQGFHVRTRIDFSTGKKFYLLSNKEGKEYEIPANVNVEPGQIKLQIERFSK